MQPLPMSLVVFLIYMSSSIFQICRVSYSLMSITSTLWNHLRHLHLAVYIAICKEKGWMKYLQLQEIDRRQQLAFLQPHAPFSPDAFLEVLVWWIVADDQVRHFLTFSSKSHPHYPVYLHRQGSQVPQPSSLLAGRAWRQGYTSPNPDSDIYYETLQRALQRAEGETSGKQVPHWFIGRCSLFLFTIGFSQTNQLYCQPVVEQNMLSLLHSNGTFDGQKQDYGGAAAE